MIPKRDAQNKGVKTIESTQATAKNREELLTKLKQLLPSVINSDNQIDTKALSDVVDIANTTSNNQGYELTFAGKGIARALADTPTEYELKAELKQSKNFDTTENVFIRGDNIDVLKILYRNYHKKIKMIYIDPPYNTKSENFVYKDNFRQNDQELINQFGLNEETTDFLQNVYGTRSHSGWLAFMYPRLKIARELLRDDGVIFISIDDNEQAQLKIICDEIFGEENLVGIMQRKQSSGSKNDTDSNRLVTTVDQILIYSKGYFKFLPLLVKQNKIYRHKDENGSFDIRALEMQGGDDTLPLREKMGFTIYYNQKTNNIQIKFDYDLKRAEVYEQPDKILIKNGYKCYRPRKRGQQYGIWRWGKDTFLERFSKGLVYFDETKVYLKERKVDFIEKYPESLCLDHLNTQGTNELKSIFERQKYFTFPKPVGLLKYLFKMSTNNKDIVLDFFAGSGTTAHAVMDLNAEDGGNRKFVLVQWDEKIDKKKSSEAYNFCEENNLEPVISSIAIERMNRAGEKIKNEVQQTKGTDDKKTPDIGYKVYSTSPKPTIGSAENELKLVTTREKTIDTITNMLCATCKTLDTKIQEIIKEKIYLADHEVYIIANISKQELIEGVPNYKNLKINLDGWAEINLEQFLNIQQIAKENLSVIY